ncbi:glycosyltransferase family 2 protein [Paraburkholderia tropica]|uniref:glycosyltransferase family 2 protein n=1 Tax=Paraburkholderia tropica TaxID=92647 RepID=UPI0030166AAC
MQSSTGMTSSGMVASDSIPLVSIALATYNGARYLPELLASIESQTWPRLELVVSDDGSTDDTLDVLRNWRGALTIRIVSSGERLGIVGNFGRAVAGCEGAYVALADQDDVWSADKIEDMVRALRAQESQRGHALPMLAYCDIEVVDHTLSRISKSYFDQNGKSRDASRLRDFLLSNHIPGCSMLLNRAAIELATPFPAGIVMHDWWLAMVVASFGAITHVDKPHIKYRQHDNNAVGASVPKRVTRANTSANASPAVTTNTPSSTQRRAEGRKRQLHAIGQQFTLFSMLHGERLPSIAHKDLKAFRRAVSSTAHAVLFVMRSKTGETSWRGLKMLRRLRPAIRANATASV